MAFDHARHQELAGGIDALGAVGCDSLGLRRDGRDALILYQHFARKRRAPVPSQTMALSINSRIVSSQFC